MSKDTIMGTAMVLVASFGAGAIAYGTSYPDMFYSAKATTESTCADLISAANGFADMFEKTGDIQWRVHVHETVGKAFDKGCDF